MELTVTTFQGLEDILADELKELGAENVEILTRAVKCEGGKELLYRANLQLRTGLRVLVPIHRFTAKDERQYYEAIREVQWRDLFKVNQCFAIHSVVNSETFTHSRFMALKAKDAIVDQFRDHFGRRPNVSTYMPDLIVNVHISGQDCTLSLDSSGEPLYKRGYKVASHEAPLNEVLAAGLLLKTEFEKFPSFHDPMCGSGTFISEALMIHTNTASNHFRDDFAFMRWQDFDDVLWAKIKAEAKEQIRAPKIEFSGADIKTKIMFAAKKNLIQIPYGDQVQIYKQDFLKDDAHRKAAFLIMNPPYDVRLESDDIDQLYADIGTKIKHEYEDRRVCVFSGNIPALQKVGLKPSIKMNVLNGAIPSKLYCYDIYSGSKKSSD
jgi:putative N6-adenine-specific DNA methylase